MNKNVFTNKLVNKIDIKITNNIKNMKTINPKCKLYRESSL
jgi:hypothetical protein